MKNNNDLYKYGMLHRGCSIGCQPNDFLLCIESKNKKYFNYLIYDRKLSYEELEKYELELITELDERKCLVCNNQILYLNVSSYDNGCIKVVASNDNGIEYELTTENDEVKYKCLYEDASILDINRYKDIIDILKNRKIIMQDKINKNIYYFDIIKLKDFDMSGVAYYVNKKLVEEEISNGLQ